MALCWLMLNAHAYICLNSPEVCNGITARKTTFFLWICLPHINIIHCTASLTVLHFTWSSSDGGDLA